MTQPKQFEPFIPLVQVEPDNLQDTQTLQGRISKVGGFPRLLSEAINKTNNLIKDWTFIREKNDAAIANMPEDTLGQRFVKGGVQYASDLGYGALDLGKNALKYGTPATGLYYTIKDAPQNLATITNIPSTINQIVQDKADFYNPNNFISNVNQRPFQLVGDIIDTVGLVTGVGGAVKGVGKSLAKSSSIAADTAKEFNRYNKLINEGVENYHGTPHKIEGGFSDKAIGSGEGNAAHMRGHYTAQLPQTAEEYRIYLSAQNKIKELGLDNIVSKDDLSMLLPSASEDTIKVIGREPINMFKDKIKGYMQQIEESINNPQIPESSKQLLIKQKQDLENILKNPSSLYDTGQLYKVYTPRDIEDKLLIENAPINKQTPFVQERIKPLVEDVKGIERWKIPYHKFKDAILKNDVDINEVFELWGGSKNRLDIAYEKFKSNQYLARGLFQKYPNIWEQLTTPKTPRDLYSMLASKYNSDKMATELLKSQGIKGNRYWGLQDGGATVYFDPSDMTIIPSYYNDGGVADYINRVTNQLSDLNYGEYFNGGLINPVPASYTGLRLIDELEGR